jgi:hypothetical protein
LHHLSASFVLGYHGCDRHVAEALLNGTTQFTASQNEWDWLGSGIYFWEANPLRGLEFAHQQKERGKLNEPFVLGAVLDLGYCLDLTSASGIAAVKAAYSNFAEVTRGAGKPMPRNRGGADALLRELDCAVINHLHQVRASARTPLQPFDSIRPDLRGVGLLQQVICIRNLTCIKGVFRVPEDHLSGS